MSRYWEDEEEQANESEGEGTVKEEKCKWRKMWSTLSILLNIGQIDENWAIDH